MDYKTFTNILRVVHTQDKLLLPALIGDISEALLTGDNAKIVYTASLLLLRTSESIDFVLTPKKDKIFELSDYSKFILCVYTTYLESTNLSIFDTALKTYLKAVLEKVYYSYGEVDSGYNFLIAKHGFEELLFQITVNKISVI